METHMTPILRDDGTLVFDNDIDSVLNIIPVDTMRLVGMNVLEDKDVEKFLKYYGYKS